MKDLLQRARFLTTFFAWGVLVSALLVGCGGGGGADGNGGKNMGASPSSTGGGGNTSSTSTTTATGATISGVAAVGSPLIGATVTVVDTNGVSQGSTTTSMADGGYQLTLSGSIATLPLLIQAKGVDMSGTPVVLYSMLQSVNTGAATTANITPLTTAVVATMLGGEPTSTFRAATNSGTALPTLLSNATAYANANTFIKTIIRLNLTDASLSSTTVDLFNDSNFHANKVGLDLTIESLRVQFGVDSSGNELLNMTNKLALAGAQPDVSVKLSTAKQGLSVYPNTISTSAFVSSAQITTSTSTVIPYLSGLETIKSALNGEMVLPAVNGTSIQALTLGTNKYIYPNALFSYQDSLDINGVTDALATYGLAGNQVSSFQVTGCLDSTVVTGRCSLVAISALIVPTSSAQTSPAVYQMTATYSSTTGWYFVGNNHRTPWNLYPVTWIQLDSGGAINTSALATPGIGLQVDIVSPASASNARLTAPNNYTYLFEDCGYVSPIVNSMCLNTLNFTGDFIADHVLSITGGLFGRSDVQAGNTYNISTQTLGNGNETNSEILRVGLPTNLTTSASGAPTVLLSTSPYPYPDGLTSSNYLHESTVDAGFTVTWATWAAAHPNMRIVEVRTSVTSPTAPSVSQTLTTPMQGTSAAVAALSVPGDAVNRFLWLIAMDEKGRRYVTKIVAAP